MSSSGNKNGECVIGIEMLRTDWNIWGQGGFIGAGLLIGCNFYCYELDGHQFNNCFEIVGIS